MAQKLWEKSVQVNKDIERFTVGRDREMDFIWLNMMYSVLWLILRCSKYRSVDQGRTGTVVG